MEHVVEEIIFAHIQITVVDGAVLRHAQSLNVQPPDGNGVRALQVLVEARALDGVRIQQRKRVRHTTEQHVRR